MIQRSLMQWFAAIKQQAIIWANVDSDLCRHMASLVHKGLKLTWNAIFHFYDALWVEINFDFCNIYFQYLIYGDTPKTKFTNA